MAQITDIFDENCSPLTPDLLLHRELKPRDIKKCRKAIQSAAKALFGTVGEAELLQVFDRLVQDRKDEVNLHQMLWEVREQIRCMKKRLSAVEKATARPTHVPGHNRMRPRFDGPN